MIEHYKKVVSKAIGYTFNRMSIYLTVFNFAMLCFYMYDNTEIGDWMKANHYRPGDLIIIAVFVLFAISAMEYILIGRNKEEEQ